jgi:nucleotide-binding universal stress UspA family protein
MFRHVLIPTDGTDRSQKAIVGGITLAKSVGARVTFLTVSPPFHLISATPLVGRDAASAHPLRDSCPRLALTIRREVEIPLT